MISLLLQSKNPGYSKVSNSFFSDAKGLVKRLGTALTVFMLRPFKKGKLGLAEKREWRRDA